MPADVPKPTWETYSSLNAHLVISSFSHSLADHLSNTFLNAGLLRGKFPLALPVVLSSSNSKCHERLHRWVTHRLMSPIRASWVIVVGAVMSLSLECLKNMFRFFLSHSRKISLQDHLYVHNSKQTLVVLQIDISVRDEHAITAFWAASLGRLTGSQAVSWYEADCGPRLLLSCMETASHSASS